MTARGGWKPRTLALLSRIDERPRRERLLLCAAAAALAFLCIDAMLFGPAVQAWQSASRQHGAALASLTKLQTDASRRQAADGARQQQQGSELAALRQRVREGEDALRSHEATLVGPDQMLPLLDRMLALHGQLKLRSMKSLGRTDLLARESTGPSPSRPANPTALPGPTLYRHGVELTIEGSFPDLLAYVEALEAIPQRVLWGNVGFKVEQYPRATLTLQLYTISRDRHWLEI